jgi:hypothetical protein
MEVGQGPNWGCSAKGKKQSALINIDAIMLNLQTNKQ